MQIAVFGCGWLGLPLTISLQKNGHNVMATCRSQQKASELNKLGLDVVQFELGDALTDNSLDKLFTAKVLVLNIPVGRKNPKAELFLEHIQALLTQAVNSQIQHVIFISTTSVYADISGVYTEKSRTNPQTQSGQVNLATEALVKSHFAGCSTIIRLAGLVGKERHPVKILAGKTELLNPNKVVNLVHQQDVIQGIEYVINNNIWGQTLVLCAPEHPTRQDYYTWAAQQLNLPLPSFIEEVGPASGKLIDASASLALLHMHLKYASPYDML